MLTAASYRRSPLASSNELAAVGLGVSMCRRCGLELSDSCSAFAEIPVIERISGDSAVNRDRDPLAPLDAALSWLEGSAAAESSAILRDQGRVLDLHLGLTQGQPRTMSEIGAVYGVSRERVRTVEARALDRLREPAVLAWIEPAFQAVGQVCADFELAPGDPLIGRALPRAFPGIRRPLQPWLALLQAIDRERWDRLDRPPGPALAEHLGAILDQGDEQEVEGMAARVAQRLGAPLTESLRFKVECALQDGGSAIGDSRSRRRLRAMRQVLADEGPLHYSEIAARMRPLLNPEDQMSEAYVHNRLIDKKDHFTWTGPSHFDLRREGDQNVPPEVIPRLRSGQRWRRGLGDAVAALLVERQPRTMADIMAEITSRFLVDAHSVRAAIRHDRTSRFVADAPMLKVDTQVRLRRKGERRWPESPEPKR